MTAIPWTPGAKLDAPIIRTSERTTWRHCPQKWWWGYREGLVGKGLPNYNFWFGTIWHEALAIFYGKGFRRYPKKARAHLEKSFRDEIALMKTWPNGIDDEPKFEQAVDLALAMWDNYVRTYGNDEHMEILATERSVLIPVYDYDGNLIAYYAMTVDGVYRDHNDHKKVKVLEHKTASVIQTSWLSLDDQAGSYLAFMTLVLRAEGVLKPNQSIQDITYNFARKEIPRVDDRPRNADGQPLNKDGTVSKQSRVQAPLLIREDVSRSRESRARIVDRVAIEAAEMMRMREDPSLVYKNPQGGPFGCSSCPFFEMCKLHEEGGDWEDLRDWKYDRKDPYADHRKAA